MNLLKSKADSIPTSLQHIDVDSTTQTILDALLESRFQNWNIDDDRNSPDAWIGFFAVHKNVEHQDGYTRTDHVQWKFGPECEKELNEKKSSNGSSRIRNSTMTEN